MSKAIVTIDLAEEVAPLLDRLNGIEVRVDALETIKASDKLSYRPKEIHALTGIDVTIARRKIANGELRGKKCGKSLLVLRSDLISWLESLPNACAWAASR